MADFCCCGGTGFLLVTTRCTCRNYLKLRQSNRTALHSNSSSSAWPLWCHLPLVWPPDSSSTHPSLLPSLLRSQISLLWPKHEHWGCLLSQLWQSFLNPAWAEGCFPILPMAFWLFPLCLLSPSPPCSLEILATVLWPHLPPLVCVTTWWVACWWGLGKPCSRCHTPLFLLWEGNVLLFFCFLSPPLFLS